MKRIQYTLFALLAAIIAFGTTGCGSCQEEVPPGFIGVRKTNTGIEKELLAPGNHTVYGRDKLILVEVKEKVSFESKMQIRCKDRMNLTLDLKVRHRLKRDKKSIATVIDTQGANIKWKFNGKKAVGVLRYKKIAQVYIEHQAREIARMIIGKNYRTDQAVQNRAEIKAAVFKALVERVKGSPVEIKEVMISNIDPPPVISNAIEKAKRREVEIQEEKSKQAKKELREKNTQKLKMMKEKNQQAIAILEAKNKMALAKLRKSVIAEEAEAEGLKMRILGKYANAAYFRLRALENEQLLYGRATLTLVKNKGDRVSPIVGAVR